LFENDLESAGLISLTLSAAGASSFVFRENYFTEALANFGTGSVVPRVVDDPHPSRFTTNFRILWKWRVAYSGLHRKVDARYEVPFSFACKNTEDGDFISL
jgi:hypothetical protein